MIVLMTIKRRLITTIMPIMKVTILIMPIMKVTIMKGVLRKVKDQKENPVEEIWGQYQDLGMNHLTVKR